MRVSFVPLLTLALLVTVARSAWPSEPNAQAAAKKMAEVTGPRVTFSASIAGVPEPLRESPDGRIIVQEGRLYDKVAGQPLGGALSHVNLNEETVRTRYVREKRTACWAFSPDGKLLAIGTGRDNPNSVRCGAIVVWDLTTGKIVASHGSTVDFQRERLGYVTEVTFSQDSQTLYYSAKSYRISGK